MADYNSSLPVRTQNNGDVVAFLADGTTSTQLLAIDASGRVTVNQGAAGASNWLTTTPFTGTTAPGTAATSSALIAGEYSSTLPTLTTGQQAAIQVDSSGRLLVNIAASAGSISVTQGTTPWVTSDLADGAVANGTAGTKSMLGGLIYLSAAPTLTSGNQNSLLGDAAGNLLVNLKTALPAGSNTIGAVTQASGPWTQNLTQVGGTAIALGQTTMAASLPVTIASNQSVLSVKDSADGPVAPGTVAANSMLIGGQYNSAGVTLTTTQQSALQLDAAGNLYVNLHTALPTGTNFIGNITTVSTVTAVTAITNALPAGTNTIGAVNQGTANTLANAWSMKITDATNGPAAVKAASTAAVAADPSLVVALSPNSPVPAGTNAIGSVLANLQVASAAVSVSNPVPVTITSASAGTPIQNAMTTASLAAGSSTTLTYTVPTGHTFSLERVWASASGKIKVVVQNGATTIFVGFNSTANPNVDITVTAPPTIAAAGTVNVIITNDDKAAFDVYATVEGNQIT